MVASSRPTASSSPASAGANGSSSCAASRRTRQNPTARPCSRSRSRSGAHLSSSHESRWGLTPPSDPPDDRPHDRRGRGIPRGDLRADRVRVRRPRDRQLLALRSKRVVRERSRRSHGGGRQARVRRPHPRDPEQQGADERVGSGRGREGAERLRAFGAERLDGVHGRAQRWDQARSLSQGGRPVERNQASEGRAPPDPRSPPRVDTPRPQPHAPAPADRARARLAAHGELPEVQGRIGSPDQAQPIDEILPNASSGVGDAGGGARGHLRAHPVPGARTGVRDLRLRGLVLVAWRLRARSAASGALLALAHLIKLMPAMLVLFVVAAGRWRVAVAMALSLLLVVVLSWPWLVPSWLDYLRLVQVLAAAPHVS